MLRKTTYLFVLYKSRPNGLIWNTDLLDMCVLYVPFYFINIKLVRRLGLLDELRNEFQDQTIWQLMHL